jgi:hypothetical protein
LRDARRIASAGGGGRESKKAEEDCRVRCMIGRDCGAGVGSGLASELVERGVRGPREDDGLDGPDVGVGSACGADKVERFAERRAARHALGNEDESESRRLAARASVCGGRAARVRHVAMVGGGIFEDVGIR